MLIDGENGDDAVGDLGADLLLFAAVELGYVLW